ncbi:MAG: type II toxin-antitoxin system PemK/MazF family toxin, partial [Epsilonproteobacteria bacterium]|nr:type II toxin-antitoxin system PemK/MazF family toxin [Campylobacterota bacterium]
MKLHDEWNEIKKSTEQINDKLYFKERDIFWARLGQNIGFEQNGKGEEFTRPVVILKKYTKDMFLAIPLSTTSRDGTFFYQFSFLPNEISTALL